MAIDTLVSRINSTKNPTCVGLDTLPEFLPGSPKFQSARQAASAVLEFNLRITDALANVVPAVKVQIACYEMLGIPGLEAFAKTCAYAKSKGLTVIADAKRGDIGSTAGYYSRAFFTGTDLGETKLPPAFECDFLTINGYLGADGIKPFADAAKLAGKGLFVLVKTSNPSSGQLQDRQLSGGEETVYEAMADIVSECGAELTGSCGYSAVGAVVGATHSWQAERLRKRFPSLFFLVPGYGAQGGTAKDAAVCFDQSGGGAIVNSSRGLLLAYRQQRYLGMTFDAAARAAAEDMRDDLSSALKG